MMTDPVGDLLTRIRNANSNKSKSVRAPLSKHKFAVAEVLQREGFVGSLSTYDSVPEDGIGPRKWLKIELKYGEDGERVLQHLQRVSKPGRRVYIQARELKPVLNGLGIQILSTSRGVLSDREARNQKVGGEILAEAH
jgi:small subunit ribosomal protein S8